MEHIHRASLRVLSEIGMDVALPEARALMKSHGAKVEGERVRFDPAMIEEFVGYAPSHFTFHARNPANSIADRRQCHGVRHRWQPAQFIRHG